MKFGDFRRNFGQVFDYGHHFDCGLGCVFDIKKDVRRPDIA